MTTVGTSKLNLYNGALIECGEGRLSSVTELRKPRYLLDDVYDRVLEECLQAGDWNFALREVKAAADTTVTESFGFTETIGKPTDWIRTAAISASDNYNPPLLDAEYQDNTDHWATNQTPIYVKYVSNDAEWGLRLDAWPASFTRYVEVALADRIIIALTQNMNDKERLERLALPRAKRNALGKDAQNSGTRFPRTSTWNNARGSRNGAERGNWSSFTG